jgi:DNA ligase (NAD+)
MPNKSSVDIKSIVKRLKAAKQAYYETESPVMSDSDFDALEDQLRAVDPTHKYFGSVGAKVERSRNVKLPVAMGSLVKMRADDGSVDAFVKENKTLYISDKLDGIAGVYFLDDDGIPKLYSRGDGTMGSDLSALIPHIKGLTNQTLVKHERIIGELVMDHATFAKVNAALKKEDKDEFKNPRNLVAGLANRRSLDGIGGGEKLSFIVHGLYKKKAKLSFGENSTYLESCGWDVVPHFKRESTTPQAVATLLASRKKKSKFLIDGLVLEGAHETYAFKGGEEVATATVAEIVWQKSRHGLLKPVIELVDPVELSGVTVSRLTAFNAGYVKAKGLGKGAVITIKRSGEVIPTLVSVVKPAKAIGLPPKSLGWVWDSNEVDAVLVTTVGDVDLDVAALQMVNSMVALGIKGFKEETMRKLIPLGYLGFAGLTDIAVASGKFLRDIEQVIGEGTARKMVKALADALKDATHVQVMDASNLFSRGFGETRFISILSAVRFEVMVLMSPTDIINALTCIDGIGEPTAVKFAEAFPAYKRLLLDTGVFPKEFEPERAASSLLKGMTFVFTGFRDATLETRVTANSGTIGSSVSSKTTMVIAALTTSLKAKAAATLGVNVLDKGGFESFLQSKGI